MRINTFTLCTWFSIVGLLSACGSGNDNTSPDNTQETAEADSPSSDDATNEGTDVTSGESATDESGNDETADTTTQDANQNTEEGTTETNPSDPQNDGEQAGSEQEEANPVAEDSDTEQPVTPPVTDNPLVNFGTAKLLVDLVPNGNSYPAKFHRAGDKLYFWTVDTDPRFASCAWHWGNLDEDDKNVAFNLVATHPETGVVAMNKQLMTLGDFAEDANQACAGFNGSIMQVFEQSWIAPLSATGEQQFVLQFDSYSLGPEQVWITDGSESNTSRVASGQIKEQSIIAGDKVFFVDKDGLSVSDTLSGNRRMLFRADNQWFYQDIKRIANSPARQETFEMRLAGDKYHVWMYDLDTDEWIKKFTIKPDNKIYVHHETLLVDGQTILSLGQDVIQSKPALAFSSNYGDVTSFEIFTDSAPTISYAAAADSHDSASENSSDRIFYSTTDYSVQPRLTSIWSYSDARIEKLFSISGFKLQIIAGHDGHIYIAGTKELQESPEYVTGFELWSYEPQTGQLLEISKDDWYAYAHNHPTPDEDYVFRYLNTPEGLIFVNLKDDSGRELWFTDGTSEGTRQLADINPGTGNSDPQNFYYSEDAIYFSANDGVHGHEPWMIPISR